MQTGQQPTEPTPATAPAAIDPLARLNERVQVIADEVLKPWREKFQAVKGAVSAAFGLKPGELERTHQAAMPARRAAVLLATERLNPPLIRAVLAEWFGVSESTLYRLHKEGQAAVLNDPEFAERLVAAREARSLPRRRRPRSTPIRRSISNPDYMSATKAARALGLSAREVYSMCALELIESFYPSPRAVVLLRRSVMRAVELRAQHGKDFRSVLLQEAQARAGAAARKQSSTKENPCPTPA